MRLLIVLLAGFATTNLYAHKGEPCQKRLTSQPHLTAEESELRDQILTLMIAEATPKVEAQQKDAELAQQLRWTANEGLDLSNGITSFSKQTSPIQLEALRLATLLDSVGAEWKKKVHLGNDPLALDLGAFPQYGIDRVLAHISFQDLLLNELPKERLMGVTYEIRLTPGHLTSINLPKVSVSIPMSRGRGNDKQRWIRRNQVIRRHRSRFDSLTAQYESLRFLHTVVSLSRANAKAEPAIFLVPESELDSGLILRPPMKFSQVAELHLAIESLFEETFNGHKDVTVLTGYQNGESRNPAAR
ncbi:MAG: hypothetical protein AB7F86_06695 [Bdellovibrionales bacterium]